MNDKVKTAVVLTLSSALFGACATTADLERVRSELERKVPAGVPPGTIAAFESDHVDVKQPEPKEIPPGWVLCNGKAYDKNDSRYSALFSAVGFSNGGDGLSKFRVPDLRGRFLRGLDAGAGRDKGVAERKAPGAFPQDIDPAVKGHDGNAAGRIGSVEEGEVGPHTHPVGSHSHTAPLGAGNGSHDAITGKYFDSKVLGSTVNGMPTSDWQGATNDNDGKETRPMNVAVFWLIKL